jgi:transposase
MRSDIVGMRRKAMVSMELREIISADNKAGIKSGTIAKVLGVPQRTVQQLLQHDRETGSMAPLPRSGRPPALDKAGLERLRGLIEEKNDITLEEMKAEMGLSIDISAVWRIVHDKLGFNFKKKPSRQRTGQRSESHEEGQLSG